jgi:ATP dependent DNA ligase-like protein
MQPMLGNPFHRPGWIYEEKYDGWCMLSFKDGARVRLISRQGVDHTERFRELALAIAALKAPTLVLDGEVCVFDKNLVSQFHLLDRAVTDEPCTPPVMMAFDVLHIHGLDVRGLPLHRRRTMLEQELEGADFVHPSRRLPENGRAAWAVVKERGYEAASRRTPIRPIAVVRRGRGRNARSGAKAAARWPATALPRHRRMGPRMRTAHDLLRGARERSTSPFHDFRGVARRDVA